MNCVFVFIICVYFRLLYINCMSLTIISLSELTTPQNQHAHALYAKLAC